MSQRLFGNFRRLCARQREHRSTRLLAHHLQLIDSSRAVNVAGHQHGAAALFDEVFCKLCSVGGLTIALQAAEHDDRLALVLDVQAGCFAAAHQSDQFFVDDLDHLLGGSQAFHDLLAHGALGHLGAEVLGNLVVDVGFQQCHAHLAHRSLDICFGQLAVAAQLFEHTGKAVGQGFKCHCAVLLSEWFSALVRFVDGTDQRQHLRQLVLILGGGQAAGAGALEPCINDHLFQFFQFLLHAAVPRRKADLFLQLPQCVLAMFDGVPRTLPGDAEVLADLAQREVIVVILAQHLALFLGQRFAVEVEQIAHFQIFCHRLTPGKLPSLSRSDVKVFCFTDEVYQNPCPLSRVFQRFFQKICQKFAVFAKMPLDA